jgi:hypothetical protein
LGFPNTLLLVPLSCLDFRILIGIIPQGFPNQHYVLYHPSCPHDNWSKLRKVPGNDQSQVCQY